MMSYLELVIFVSIKLKTENFYEIDEFKNEI